MRDSFLFDSNFWIAAFERAVKSLAQGFLVAGVGDTAGLLTLDWTAVLSIAIGMFLASLLTSIASGGVSGDNSPSLTSAEVLKTDVAAIEYDGSPTGYLSEEAAAVHVEEGVPVTVDEAGGNDGKQTLH